MGVTLSAAALALGLAASPCGLPPLAAGRPFAPGETLTFDVDVMGVVKAGSLRLRVQPPSLGGSQLALEARMQNSSVFAKVRRVKGVALSFVDATSLRPQRYRDDVDQDGVRKRTEVRLDRPGPLRMTWSVDAETGVKEFTRQSDAVDLLSGLYWLRAAELRPGAELCFDLFGNWRLWRLSGKVASRPERVNTAAGDFETLRIDARLVRADDPRLGRPMHLWISTDPRHLLVAAVSEVDLGPVRAMLVKATD
jgi:hypothetical protein